MASYRRFSTFFDIYKKGKTNIELSQKLQNSKSFPFLQKKTLVLIGSVMYIMDVRFSKFRLGKLFKSHFLKSTYQFK